MTEVRCTLTSLQKKFLKPTYFMCFMFVCTSRVLSLGSGNARSWRTEIVHKNDSIGLRSRRLSQSCKCCRRAAFLNGVGKTEIKTFSILLVVSGPPLYGAQVSTSPPSRRWRGCSHIHRKEGRLVSPYLLSLLSPDKPPVWHKALLLFFLNFKQTETNVFSWLIKRRPIFGADTHLQ